MTYSAEDYEIIAEAVGVPVDKVTKEGLYLDVAAEFYRLEKNAPKRTPPSVLTPRLKSIRSNAIRLLAALKIYEPELAADGPPPDLLGVLASHTKDNEEPVILQATDRVGKLVEILNVLADAAEAAKTLERYSDLAIESVKTVHAPLTTAGNRGDYAVNNWLDAAMTIYVRITGRSVGTSVASTASGQPGEAGGPLIRFLSAASAPLEINYSASAWRKRIRSIRESAAPVD